MGIFFTWITVHTHLINCCRCVECGDNTHDNDYACFDFLSFQCMIEASPSERPLAKQVLSHPVICPSTQKSKVSPLTICLYTQHYFQNFQYSAKVVTCISSRTLEHLPLKIIEWGSSITFVPNFWKKYGRWPWLVVYYRQRVMIFKVVLNFHRLSSARN